MPHRTSAPDGIGDYAVNLARQLRDRFDVSTIFIAGTPPGQETDSDDEWPTLRVKRRTPSALIESLDMAAQQAIDAPLILHVCGYGYAPRGAPIWLARGMRRWRAIHPRRRMIGVFHELYAKGPITSSSFWLSGLQKQVTKSLWHDADAALTTTPSYAAQLASWRPCARARITELPVPSNVGEPLVCRPVNERENRAVVFGRPGVEDVLYGKNRDQLVEALGALGVDQILDIGSRNSSIPDKLGPITVTPLGRLTATEISRLMLTSRFGILAYDQKRLGKSTIFAAFAAHGVIPICIGLSEASQGAPESGRHFLISPTLAVTEDKLQSIQDQLVSWYRTHDQRALANAVTRLTGLDRGV